MCSVLQTVEVPDFDSSTGQLALRAHHLVSAPTSIVEAFDAAATLLFDPPPEQPYKRDDTTETTGADVGNSRRKRRRVDRPDETASPADWLRYRERQENRQTTTTDQETDAHHAAILPRLQAAVDAVRASWRDGSAAEDAWTGPPKGFEWRSDKTAERPEIDLVELACSCGDKGPATSPLALPEGELSTLDAREFFHRLILNDSTTTAKKLRLIDAPTEALPTLLLPASSGFLLSDMKRWSDPSSGLAQLGREKGGWDVLLIDPPWPNASATRSSSYETFDPYDLWQLDVPALLGDKPALVAVWLTNRVKFRRLVKDKLFPAWSVCDVVEWYWVKIAAETGEPVWPLGTKHRRCYEGLLVGRYIPKGAKQEPISSSIPSDKVFLSTPIGHSRKPYILDLLRPYLSDPSRPPNVLELFARMTLAGPRMTAPAEAEAAPAEGSETRRGFFCATGNEAVKFNVVDDVRGAGLRGWIRTTEPRSSDGTDREAEEAFDAIKRDPRPDLEV